MQGYFFFAVINSMKVIRYLLCFLILSGMWSVTDAQPTKTTTDAGRPQQDKTKKGLVRVFNPPDTLRISVYHADHPEEKYAYPDTLLNNYFQQADPIRRQMVDYSYLGSLGTPAKPIWYEVKPRRGIDIGFSQFDLYSRSLDSVRYFNVNRTFTDLYYGQGATKDDFIIKGIFTRNMTPQWNLTVDYDRISHLGFYTHQKSRHTALSTNASFLHKKKRYKAYMSYSYNDMQQEDNGGITRNDLFEDEFYRDRSSIPVFLSSANTRMEEHILSYTHYYELLSPKKDSLNADKNRHLTIGHQFMYSPGDYKFVDKSLDEDSVFYQDLQVDDRGLRHFLAWDKLENKIKLSTYKSAEGKNRPRDLFSVGLHQMFWKINQEPKDTSYNAVFLFGQWDYRPSPFINLSIYGQYGIGNATNEYVIKGTVSTNLKQFGQLQVEFLNQRYPPDVLQQRLFISKRNIYENNWAKPITTSLSASYRLPKTKTAIHAGYHILNNYIYRDTLGYTQQVGDAINLFQVTAQQDFRFGVFGMENTLTFQATDNNYIRVPSLMVKNSLFLEGRVFNKVMLARLGFDFRLNTSYYADEYQPVLGQFHLQDHTLVEAYPALDVFVSIKVQTFRAFAKMENISDWFTKKRYYQIPGHPMPDAHFRFGAAWRFID